MSDKLNTLKYVCCYISSLQCRIRFTYKHIALVYYLNLHDLLYLYSTRNYFETTLAVRVTDVYDMCECSYLLFGQFSYKKSVISQILYTVFLLNYCI